MSFSRPGRKIAAFAAVIILTGCASQTPALISMSRDAGSQEKTIKREDAAFRKLKNDLETRKLWSGASKERVQREYGPPVAVLRENGDERWLYKARGKDWFGAQKIYLIFGADGKLEDLDDRRVFS